MAKKHKKCKKRDALVYPLWDVCPAIHGKVMIVTELPTQVTVKKVGTLNSWNELRGFIDTVIRGGYIVIIGDESIKLPKPMKTYPEKDTLPDILDVYPGDIFVDKNYDAWRVSM